MAKNPLNRDLLLSELKNDEDSAFLCNGVCNGFKLVQPGTSFFDVDMDNYKSATNPVNRPKVKQTIRGEIAHGNYVILAVKPRIISTLGAIPKPNSSEIRIIHDCSRPHGQAVNDYISTQSFKFQTLDDAVKLLNPNYYMAKIDLRHAYARFRSTRITIRRLVVNGNFLGISTSPPFTILAYLSGQKAHRKFFTVLRNPCVARWLGEGSQTSLFILTTS